jgi:hypothetical protein
VLAHGRPHVNAIYLARRVIPGEPGVVQLLLGVELSWWGRFRSQQEAVVHGLAACEWPVALMIVAVDGRFARLKKKFRALGNARLA